MVASMVSSKWAQVATSFALSSSKITARSSIAVTRVFQRSLLIKNNGRPYTVAAAQEVTEDISEPVSDINPPLDPLHFSTLKDLIHHNTLKAITDGPFRHTHMSIVQAEVLPLLPRLAEPHDTTTNHVRDLLVKARTGTGKTMAFLIPAIESRLKALEAEAEKSVKDAGLQSDRLLSEVKRKHARETVGTLIISPTRELASQIAKEAQKLTSHHPGFEVQLFVGGESKHQQMREFRNGRKDFLVATPGRLRDFMESPDSGVTEALRHTKVLVLDEADTLLDMGFRDDIEAITRILPPAPMRQTFLFSATVSSSIRQIARTTLADNHHFINCVSEDDSPVHAHIPQYHTVLPSAEQQIPHLLRLIFHDQLLHRDKSKIIVFFPTTKMTQLFTSIINQLSRTSLPVRRTTIYEIHSKKAMNARKNVSDRFRECRGATILVTSDVSARGVDYPGVTRVIQVGLPSSAEQYIHRIGRTGRAGNTTGRGDLLVLPWEYEFVRKNMSHIPMIPLKSSDFKAEVKEASTAFDANPNSANGKVITPTSALFDDIPRHITELLPRLDPEDVGETMISQLGFYGSRSVPMGMNMNEILEGMKKWAVEACGLSRPPHVSATMLSRMGISGAERSRSSSFRSRTEWRDDRPKRGDRPSYSGNFTPRSGSQQSSYGGRSEHRSSYGGRSEHRSSSESRPERRSPYEDRSSRRSFEDRSGRWSSSEGRKDRRGGESFSDKLDIEAGWKSTGFRMPSRVYDLQDTLTDRSSGSSSRYSNGNGGNKFRSRDSQGDDASNGSRNPFASTRSRSPRE